MFGKIGGKRSGESRRAKIQAFSPNEAQRKAMQQVDKILRWMDKENDRDRYSQLTGMLDRVWNKAFPTQGAVKSRQRDRAPSAIPIEETPQEPPASQVS